MEHSFAFPLFSFFSSLENFISLPFHHRQKMTNDSSSAAADAYYYLEGHIIDNRKWRVDYAKPSDFRFFE
jgi:hypothetical protein